MNKSTSAASRFFVGTFSWTIILLMVPAVAQVLEGPPIADQWTYGQVVYLISAWVGLSLPFAAIAGGIRAFPLGGRWGLWSSAFLVSVMALILGGFLTPHLRVRAQVKAGIEITERYPTGPLSVSGLRRLLALSSDAPPAEYGFSPERVLELPPNWIQYRIHTFFAFSLFAILAAFIGARTAGLTTGLSPPNRRNVRWAVGLVSGGLFFAGGVPLGEWVRADPSHSGVLGAWGALLVPLCELGVLSFLLHRVRRRSTASPPFPSDV